MEKNDNTTIPPEIKKIDSLDIDSKLSYQNVKKFTKIKLPFTGKLTWFFSGMSLTFLYFYFQYMEYMELSDKRLRQDIEDLKQLIKTQNQSKQINLSDLNTIIKENKQI